MVPLHRRLQKYEDAFQLGTGLVAAVVVGWRHAHLGQQSFWQWFPAAFFAFFGVEALWVIVWFVRRKATYQHLAALNKADLKSGGDGWPRHRNGGS